MKTRTDQVRLEVFNPLSDIRMAAAANADRLDTLEGKTICEVWPVGGFRGDSTFPIIRELLQKRFPNTKFVPYTEFPHARHGLSPYGIPIDKVGEVLRGKGCDAAVVGNSG